MQLHDEDLKVKLATNILRSYKEIQSFQKLHSESKNGKFNSMKKLHQSIQVHPHYQKINIIDKSKCNGESTIDPAVILKIQDFLKKFSNIGEKIDCLLG